MEMNDKNRNAQDDNEKINRAIKGKKASGQSKVWFFIDIIVFLIIIIAISTTILLISSSPEDPNKYYSNYHDSDEYVNLAMETLLSSTIPRIEYQNIDATSDAEITDPSEIEFTDRSIEWLIKYELHYYSEGFGTLNHSMNNNALEKFISTAMNHAFGNTIQYVLLAGFSEDLNQTNLDQYKVLIFSNINFDGDLNDMSGAVFEKRLNNNYSKSMVDGTDNFEQDGEILIKLFFF
jgi:hypothetical protein